MNWLRMIIWPQQNKAQQNYVHILHNYYLYFFIIIYIIIDVYIAV